MFKKYIKFNKPTLVIGTLFTFFGILGLYLWSSNNFSMSEIAALSVTNRTINTYFLAIITAMALIITLTSNLYSPRLAKLFVSHPIAVTGIVYIVCTNFFIAISHLVPIDSDLFKIFSFLSFSFVLIAMVGMIPFLFYISKFVKPSYFVPLMGKNGLKEIARIHNDKLPTEMRKKECGDYFDLVDVLSNMTMTSIKRGDRLVTSLVLKEMFLHLRKFIALRNDKQVDQIWRKRFSRFPLGMSEEAKYYLKKYEVWPESYLLSKILEVYKVFHERDNELVPFVCRELTNVVDDSLNLNDRLMIKLQLKMLNSMLRRSLSTNNEEAFSSILYYYRINIELLLDDDDLCEDTIYYFIYYGKLARRLNQPKAVKSFLFSIGRIMNYLCFESPDRALMFYNKFIKDIWLDLVSSEGLYRDYAMKSIIKTFWSLYSQNYSHLSSMIQAEFLSNSQAHAMYLDEMLYSTDPLDKEFSDELVSPEHMSGMALSLASDFLKDFNLNKSHTR